MNQPSFWVAYANPSSCRKNALGVIIYKIIFHAQTIHKTKIGTHFIKNVTIKKDMYH